MFRYHKKGFTLVEMLIVIVIIGILAAALIPRLMTARGRANDTARKADIHQVSTAVIAYQVDSGKFPETAGSIDLIRTELTKGGLASMPSDPDKNNVFSGVVAMTGTMGEYMYTPIYKNGAINGGFIIMAKTETEKSSNYVFCGGPQIDTQTNYDEIFLCSSITPADDCVSSFTGNSDCTYIKSEGQLRYIYKY